SGFGRDDADGGEEGPCLVLGSEECRTPGSRRRLDRLVVRGARPGGGRTGASIQSVDRAARILKALAAGSPRLGVSELAERVGLAKTTVHRLLRRRGRQDLVEQDPETGKYPPAPELLQLGTAFLDNHELRSRSLVWAD